MRMQPTQHTSHTFTSYNPQRIIKMKLTLALVASLVTGSFALQSISEVKAESNFGMDLLSKARRVEEAEVDTTRQASQELMLGLTVSTT